MSLFEKLFKDKSTLKLIKDGNELDFDTLFKAVKEFEDNERITADQYLNLLKLNEELKLQKNELQSQNTEKDNQITQLKNKIEMLLAQLLQYQNGNTEEPLETEQVISNNRIINGLYDDTEHVEYDSDFTIASSKVIYTHSAGNTLFTWDLNQPLETGVDYKLIIDIINSSGNARFRLFAKNLATLTELVANTTYDNGTQTINFTSSVDAGQLVLLTSSAATNFEFDNSILLLQGEDIEYEEVPVDGNPVDTNVYAFPTAYGAGAYATGGRGGIVVHITNLNADGEGSLRWALADPYLKTQDRTIIPDVSGVVDLGGEDIVLSGSRAGSNADGGITFAGQAAPLGGITVTNGKIRMFSVDNVIWRYTKFRETAATDGCLSNTDGNNVIFDHLSGSHSPDILFALTSNAEISDSKTIQNCLMAQSKNALIVGDTTPSSSTEYYERCSILRNAYYNISHRIPLKGGARIRVDAINNIAHNWAARLIRMDGFAYELNHIGNYYQGGYNTTNILKHCSYLSTTGDPKIYNDDNYMDPAETTPEYLTDESVVWTEYQNNFVPLPESNFVDTPNPIRGRAIEILPSAVLKSQVLPYVGAYKYLDNNGNVAIYRDDYDTAYINGIDTDDEETRSTALSTIDSLSNTRPEGFYNPAKSEHIPEVWFDANVPTGQTHNDIAPNGYTWLENYLNQVDV
ncbi:MAG: hypothetical protein KDD03_13335 [Gelidibacter sp.]|nr:hypothetical protein [Gelidibacter sp.]